jgi:hypothetical protein
MILGVQAAQSAASMEAYAPRGLRADQVLVTSPAAAAAVTQSLPGARQAPFTTAKDANGDEVTVHGPVIDHDNIAPSRGLAIGDHQLLVAMGGEQAAAAFARGAVVAFGTGLVPDGQVTLAITDLPRPARRITVPAVEITTGSYMGETLPSFVISRQTATKLALPGLATPPRYLVRAPRPLSEAQHDQLRGLQTRFPDITITWAQPDPDQQTMVRGVRSIVLALLVAAVIIALGSVTAACALALTEAREDLTTLAQLGAPLGMTRRLVAAEAWLLAGLGALLAVAAGLIPAAVATLATSNIRPSLPIPSIPTAFAVPWTLLAVVTLAIHPSRRRAPACWDAARRHAHPGEVADHWSRPTRPTRSGSKRCTGSATASCRCRKTGRDAAAAAIGAVSGSMLISRHDLAVVLAALPVAAGAGGLRPARRPPHRPRPGGAGRDGGAAGGGRPDARAPLGGTAEVAAVAAALNTGRRLPVHRVAAHTDGIGARRVGGRKISAGLGVVPPDMIGP